MTTPWRIELFGGLQAQGEGRLVTRYRSSKTGALLAFLALRLGRSQPRESLIEMFWPQATVEAGRLSLRVALNALRSQLEPDDVTAGSILRSDRLHVRLNPAAIVTDVAEFEGALKAASEATSAGERLDALMQAATLYRGELLAGYYEEWILPERERLAHLYLQGLDLLCGALRETGDLERAVEYGLRAVAADPLRERSYRTLIRLYLELDRPADAVRCYRRVERVLKQHLGVRPEAATRSLAASWRKRGQVVTSAMRSASHPPAKVVSQEPPLLRARLPQIPTRFFGRERELERLEGILSSNTRHTTPHAASHAGDKSPVGWSAAESLRESCADTRLVTLTGPGGAGKTRLAIEVARRMSVAFEGAVWFVPMADVTRADEIVGRIAETLELASAEETDPMNRIVTALARRRALLLLDNFEHLAQDGAPIVQNLLHGVPSVTLLVTSRCRLAAGQSVALAPLATPDSEALSVEQLMQYDSVQLLLDRVQTVRADLNLTPENAETVATICRRLDGLPLGIELAAGWAHVLSLRQIAARLQQRVDSFAKRMTNGPERHASLGAMLDWSWRLLDPDIRTFLESLSVFQGSWSLEAAQAICSETEALPMLSELCERSLVATLEAAGEMRFRLLEPVREYALDRLSTAARAHLGQRHAAWYLAFAERAEAGLHGADPRFWVERVRADYANLLAALDSTDGTEANARLAAALSFFWVREGGLGEAFRRLERARTGVSRLAPCWRAKTLAALAAVAWMISQKQTAQECFEALELVFTDLNGPEEYRAALLPLTVPQLHLGSMSYSDFSSRICRILQRGRHDSRLRAFWLCHAALQHYRDGHSAESENYFREALALSRDATDRAVEAVVCFQRSAAAMDHSDLPMAARLRRQSLAILRALDDRVGMSLLMGELSYVVRLQGNYAEAELLAQSQVTLSRELGWSNSGSLWNLGTIYTVRGEYDRATTVLEESLEMRREENNTWGIADALHCLGVVACAQGRYQDARNRWEEALALRRPIGENMDVAYSFSDLGLLALLEGCWDEAERMLQESLAICHRFQDATVAARISIRLGLVACRHGDLALAEKRLREGLSLPYGIAQPITIVEGLEAYAELRLGQAQFVAAATLHGSALAAREKLGAPLPPRDRLRWAQEELCLRTRLGDNQFIACLQAGRDLTPELAFAFALESSQSAEQDRDIE